MATERQSLSAHQAAEPLNTVFIFQRTLSRGSLGKKLKRRFNVFLQLGVSRLIEAR